MLSCTKSVATSIILGLLVSIPICNAVGLTPAVSARSISVQAHAIDYCHINEWWDPITINLVDRYGNPETISWQLHYRINGPSGGAACSFKAYQDIYTNMAGGCGGGGTCAFFYTQGNYLYQGGGPGGFPLGSWFDTSSVSCTTNPSTPSFSQTTAYNVWIDETFDWYDHDPTCYSYPTSGVYPPKHQP